MLARPYSESPSSGFRLSGQIPAKRLAADTGLECDYHDDVLARPVPRHNEFPLDLNIVLF